MENKNQHYYHKNKSKLLVEFIKNTLNLGAKAQVYQGDSRYKVLHHRENFSYFLAHEDYKIRPITTDFWPSLACNAECLMCPYGENGNKARSAKHNSAVFPSERLTLQLVSQWKKLGIKGVNLTGGGEPLLNPGIGKIAQVIRENELDFSIYTNAAVPNRDRQIEQIIQASPTYFRISVNAGSEIEHQEEYRIRPFLGKNSWQILKENILTAMNAIRKYKVNTQLILGYILSGDESADTYEGMATFLTDISGLSKKFSNTQQSFPLIVQFRPKVKYFMDNGAPVTEYAGEDIEIYNNIEIMVEKIVQDRMSGFDNISISVNIAGLSFLMDKTQVSQNISTCWSTSFDHRGNGYISCELCGSSSDNVEWCSQTNSIGNIENEWFAPKRVFLYNKYASGEFKMPAYFKLAVLNKFLCDIRDLGVTPFNDEEIKDFWRIIDKEKISLPMHINHI